MNKNQGTINILFNERQLIKKMLNIIMHKYM